MDSFKPKRPRQSADAPGTSSEATDISGGEPQATVLLPPRPQQQPPPQQPPVYVPPHMMAGYLRLSPAKRAELAIVDTLAREAWLQAEISWLDQEAQALPRLTAQKRAEYYSLDSHRRRPWLEAETARLDHNESEDLYGYY